MIRTLTIILAFVAGSFLTTMGGQEAKKTFYAYKGAGKQIEKMQKILVVDKAGFNFGFQSYNQFEIKNTAAFYNQPTDIFHYVLTTKSNYTLHFQIPLLQLKETFIIAEKSGTKQLMEFVCKEGSAIRVKQQNEKGLITFDLQFTRYQVPVSNSQDIAKLKKVVDKIISKANSFTS